MSNSDVDPAAGLSEWLAAQHRHMVTDLTATLDLETGLREATIPARHANLVADLDGVLDVEAGLSAIVPAAHGPTPHEPEPPGFADVADDLKQASPDPRSLTDLEHLVRGIEPLSPSTRLAMRTDPAFDLASDIVRVLGSARVRDIVRVLNSARVLDGARDSDLELARDLARVLDLAVHSDSGHESDHTRALYRVLTHTHARVCDLGRARDLHYARVSDLYGSFTGVRARYRVLVFYRVPALYRARVRVRARHLARDLARTTRVVADLHHALNDFTGVDLRHADLDGIPLDGLRWSTKTQWPLQWAEQVRRDSVEVEDGIFEIHGGNWRPIPV